MLAFQCMCGVLWVRVNVHVYVGHLLLFCLGRTARSRMRERERNCSVVLTGHQRLLCLFGVCMSVLQLFLTHLFPLCSPAEFTMTVPRVCLSLTHTQHTHHTRLRVERSLLIGKCFNKSM